MITPVILAGGSGTRLWPLSRQLYPKQFLPLIGETTLLQQTALRFADADLFLPPIIVCNEEHRFMVAEQLRLIHIEPAAIILEPAGRNTAPAASLAASAILQKGGDLMLLAPADHHFRAPKEVLRVLRDALSLTHDGRLVTFGIVPDKPETGYGYIERGTPLPANGSDTGYAIARFVEKPDSATAQQYLESGTFYWNSGMFLFSATAYQAELKTLRPDIAEAAQQAMDTGTGDALFFRPAREIFAECPAESIDYAVMEHTRRGVVMPLDAGWSDVGSWSALWDIGDKTSDGNVTVGDVLTLDVEQSYLHSTGRLLAVAGLRDHVVVETPDAVLVAPKDKVQDVKQLVDAIRKEKRPEADTHKRVYRPWGAYETIDLQGRFQVKRITVKPGAKLSLQKHFHRAEHWVVVSGTARVTRGDEEIILTEDQSTYISLGEAHRLENPGKIPLELIEVQTGSYLGEDDIVRFDDVYGRLPERG